MRSRLKFSIKALLAAMTLLAVGLGGWLAYTNYKIKKLTELRHQDAIVIIRKETPGALQSLGIEQLPPFSSVPTVELYVTPKGASATIGNSEELLPNAVAQKYILEQATEARNNGAQDIQLILVDTFDPEWANFAQKNSMSVIGDTKERYQARLKANQESGANINP
jgi:hypothetical protein